MGHKGGFYNAFLLFIKGVSCSIDQRNSFFCLNTKERNKEKVKHGGGYDTAVHTP